MFGLVFFKRNKLLNFKHMQKISYLTGYYMSVATS